MNYLKERFKLTTPKTIAGDETTYYFYLREMAYGVTFTRFETERMGKHMTFQAMREKGLIATVNKRYEITEAGKFYVKYVESTNRPKKDVLRAIMGVK